MGKIYSVPGLFGGEDFFDESGRKVGCSVPGLFGGRDFFDADGKRAGFTVDSILSGEDFYDDQGALKGFSTEGILGGHEYFDASGRPVGWSSGSAFGEENILMDDADNSLDGMNTSDALSWDEQHLFELYRQINIADCSCF